MKIFTIFVVMVPRRANILPHDITNKIPLETNEDPLDQKNRSAEEIRCVFYDI